MASPPRKAPRVSQLTPLLVLPSLAIVVQPATPTTPHDTPPVTPINTTLLSPPSLKRRPLSKPESGPATPPTRPASAPPRLTSFNRPSPPPTLPGSSPPWYLSRNSLTARRTGRTVTVPPPPLVRPTTFWRRANKSGLVSISINRSPIYPHSPSNQESSEPTSSSSQAYAMYLGSVTLPTFICVGLVVAAAPPVARQETTMFLFGPSTTFDWWPFDNFETSLVPQPSLTSTRLSQSLATSTSFTSSSPLSYASPSPSPSIINITALPPATTNSPHPQMRTKQTLKPSYLAPVFGLVGLLPGVLVGWLVSRSYQRWVAKRATVPLLPGPAYVPVERVDEWADGDRGGTTVDVEGSPSKHTRHGTAYSSYSVGRGLLGRIPSSRLYKPLPPVTQERAESASSEKSFAWPSLPGSSRPTPSHSRATTISTKSTQTPTRISDDPFMSTENTSTGSTKFYSAVAASRTSTRSTFAHSSRFGEMWSGDEEDQDAVVASPFSQTHPAEEGEIRADPLKIRSKSKSAKGKKRDETSGLPSPAREISSRKSSWNFPWITGSPPVKPDSYTVVPARTLSPRSQSFRTPESSPRKPSYVRSSERARIVDTSVLPASPPTLTSPRLESELFLSAMVFDVPGTPTPKRTRSPRTGTDLRRGTGLFDTDTLDATSTPLPHRDLERSDESHTPPKRDSRLGPSRHLSTTSTISEFPGDAPRKRTPAERFYARHSTLDKVEEIIQRGRSQTSLASASTVTLSTGEEDRRFGYVGREFKSSGIEQRLFEP